MTTVTATLHGVPITLLGHLLVEVDDVECEIEVGRRCTVKSVVVTAYGKDIRVTADTPGDAVAGILDRAQDWLDANADAIDEARQDEADYRREAERDRNWRMSEGR